MNLIKCPLWGLGGKMNQKKSLTSKIFLSVIMLVIGYAISQDSLETTEQREAPKPLEVTGQTEDTGPVEVAEQPDDLVKPDTAQKSEDNQPADEVAEPKAKILIARQESDFKHAVTLQTKKLLKEQNLDVECVDIKTLKKKAIKDYDAIIIINAVRAWHLNIHSRQFYDKLEQLEREKIIMVTTAKTDWEAKEKDIDAMTVASEMNTVDELAETIFKKIILLLKLD